MTTNKFIRHVFLGSLFLLVTAALFSCGFEIRTRSLMGGRLHVTVEIDEKANQDNPIALDLLFVYDEKLLERLLQMPAKEWFEKRDQIKRDYLEGDGLDYWGWEWVPNQKIPIQELPLKSGAEGALVFADYLSPGDHRIRVDPFKDISIHLKKEDFEVTSSEY
jgi:type VI secretion system protein